MFTVYGIMVLYNKPLLESNTFNSLMKLLDHEEFLIYTESALEDANKNVESKAGFELIIVDNSEPEKISAADNAKTQIAVKQRNCTYISMDGNKGLPKAYNAALDVIKAKNSDMIGFAMLLDDDTEISKSYLQEVFSQVEFGAQIEVGNKYAAEKLMAGVYLPVIYDEIGMMSPSTLRRYYAHRAMCKPEEILDKRLCGINSGMLISLGIFRTYRYNEKMFLDYVDHIFIRDMRDAGVRMEVLYDAVLNQHFSGNIHTVPQARKRFKIFKKDVWIFCKESPAGWLTYLYIIIRRKMKFVKQYDDWKLFFTM